jgi:hypothetical protein
VHLVGSYYTDSFCLSSQFMRIMFLWIQVTTVFTISRNTWKHFCSWVRGAVVQKDRTVFVQCRPRLCSLLRIKIHKTITLRLGRPRNQSSISGKSAELPKGLHGLWGSPSPLFNNNRGYSAGWICELWADHSSSPSSAEVKNAGNCNSTLHVYIAQCEIWSLCVKNVDWNFIQNGYVKWDKTGMARMSYVWVKWKMRIF